MTWTELPQGQSIVVKAGFFYAATAQVKNNHDAAMIRSKLAGYGVTILDYQDPAPGMTAPDGYRIVAAQVFAPKDAGTLPWGVPGILSWADDTHILRAWAAPQGAGPATPPSPPPGEPPWGWIILGLTGVAGAGLWWWSRHRRGGELRLSQKTA